MMFEKEGEGIHSSEDDAGLDEKRSYDYGGLVFVDKGGIG